MSSPAPPRAVTSADVARLAGVSTAVVSYVVNDGPRKVAAETAERVRRAIVLLDYTPNLSARALKRGQTGMLGLVLPDSTNPYFAELAHAVQEEARRREQVVVTVNHGSDRERQRRLVQDLGHRGVQHVLVASPAGSAADTVASGVPTVLLDCAQPIDGVATVGPDSEAGAEAAVRHLIEVHGHEKVAIALGESGQFGAENRERGWSRGCRAGGVAEGLVERADFTREGGYAVGRRLLRRSDRPRAIFVSSDLQAFGLIRALWEEGLSVPDDVAVISFDGTAGTRYSGPPLTVVQQPVQAMAAAALDRLLAAEGPRAGHQSFPMELVIRRSCGCPYAPGTATGPDPVRGG